MKPVRVVWQVQQDTFEPYELVASFPCEADAVAFSRERNGTAPIRCYSVLRSLSVNGKVAV